jgi:anti-anti-sigma regulatory factor
MKLESRTYADIVVVAASGRLDHDNCDHFRAGMQPYLEAALGRGEAALARGEAAAGRGEAGGAGSGIVLDLSELEYVSSAGLRCFMLVAKEVRGKGGKVVLAALRPVVAEIFQISRFDMVFELHPAVRAALAALSPDAAAAYDRG